MERGGRLHFLFRAGGTEKIRTLTAKLWQMVQSSNTKSENLEHDFDEIVAKVQELGWKDAKRLCRCWVQKEEGL